MHTRKQREWDPLLTQLDRWLGALAGERGAGVDVRSRLERLRGVVAVVDRLSTRFLQGGALGTLGSSAGALQSIRTAPVGEGAVTLALRSLLCR